MRPHILVPLLLLTLLCAVPAGAAPAAPATEHAPSSLYDSSSPTMPAGPSPCIPMPTSRWPTGIPWTITTASP